MTDELDEEAADPGNGYGMRGGLTPAERVALWRQRRRAAAVPCAGARRVPLS
jgi:hypothetical protein